MYSMHFELVPDIIPAAVYCKIQRERRTIASWMLLKQWSPLLHRNAYCSILRVPQWRLSVQHSRLQLLGVFTSISTLRKASSERWTKLAWKVTMSLMTNWEQLFGAYQRWPRSLLLTLTHYPAPGRYRERGIVFARFLSLFVCIFVSLYLCIFVSLSARLRENGWTDLHEIFREGVEWPWDDVIQFWVNSGERVAPKPPKTPK